MTSRALCLADIRWSITDDLARGSASDHRDFLKSKCQFDFEQRAVSALYSYHGYEVCNTRTDRLNVTAGSKKPE